MSSSFTIVAAQPVEVKPSQTKYVAQTLFPPASSSSKGYVLARAGINNNGGPVCIRLVDQYGNALSDYVESSSSLASLLLLPNVRVPSSSSGLPEVIRVEVVNKSIVEHSNAVVENVLLLLD